MFPNRLSPVSDTHLIPDAPPDAGAAPSQPSNNHLPPQAAGHPGQGRTPAWASQMQQHLAGEARAGIAAGTGASAQDAVAAGQGTHHADPEWQSLMRASPEEKLAFLNAFQAHLRVGLRPEEEVSDAILQQEMRGNYTESDMDEGAVGEAGKSTTGSLGAGSCILGFMHARTADGKQSVSSIHNSHALDNPQEAIDHVIQPLFQNAVSQLAQPPQHVDLYFVGGNKPESFNSCLAVAVAAKNVTRNSPHFKLKVSMLGINDNEDENVNAILQAPASVHGNASFLVAKLDE
jgi:hypothetical protein